MEIEVQTLVVGRSSNLSRHLQARLESVTLISARQLLTDDPANFLPNEPFQVVLNNFQPATQIRNLQNPMSYIGVSISVTAKILEALAGRPCVKVVYTSSASVYGDDVHCREEAAPRAGGLHSALKVANERLVAGFCEGEGIDSTVVRVFNMYGGDDDFSIVSKILAAARSGDLLQINNHGNAVRDFIHIDDVVSCYAAILTARCIPVVNVATGIGVSIRGILDTLRLHGRDVKVQSSPREEIRVSTADVERLGRLVNVEGFVSVLDYVVTNA